MRDLLFGVYGNTHIWEPCLAPKSWDSFGFKTDILWYKVLNAMAGIVAGPYVHMYI